MRRSRKSTTPGKTIIPAGYRLTVTSWENDADNYNTVVLEGLTLEQVTFNVELCKLFENSTDWENLLCNLYEPDDEDVARVHAALIPLMKKFHPEEVARCEGDDEMLGDIAMDYLGDLSLTYGEWFTRVCESWKVEYIPNEIILEDVTEKFK
jgi:hypothetical protein